MIAVTVIVYLLYFYLALLFIRMIMSWVMVLSRDFRPTGLLAAVLELTYTLTDPPLRFLRRFLPPLRLGGSFALDLGFLVLFIVVVVVIQVLQSTA